MTHKNPAVLLSHRKVFLKLPLLPLHQIVQLLHTFRQLLHLYNQGNNITDNYNFESQEKSQTLSQFADHNHNLNNPHDFQNQVKQGLVLII